VIEPVTRVGETPTYEGPESNSLPMGKMMMESPIMIRAIPAKRKVVNRSPKTSADAITPVTGDSKARGATAAAG
jgi:hypothetical protein